MTQLVFCKETLSMLREKLNFFEKLIQYQAARQIPKSPSHKIVRSGTPAASPGKNTIFRSRENKIFIERGSRHPGVSSDEQFES